MEMNEAIEVIPHSVSDSSVAERPLLYMCFASGRYILIHRLRRLRAILSV
jgi:hypothetical protein